MNEEVKYKIKALKEQGYGYKKIAKELSLTTSAVRYAFTRLNEEDTLISECRHCGISMKSVKGKKKKIYCSDKCRYEWWNQKHRDEKHHETN